MIIGIKEYICVDGSSPFANWFDGLDAQAAVKIRTYVIRMQNGNMSQVKGVGEGVFECRIDYGPGYRIYFAKDGGRLIILLGGGTKKRQQNDINNAKILWQDYKRRK